MEAFPTPAAPQQRQQASSKQLQCSYSTHCITTRRSVGVFPSAHGGERTKESLRDEAPGGARPENAEYGLGSESTVPYGSYAVLCGALRTDAERPVRLFGHGPKVL